MVTSTPRSRLAVVFSLLVVFVVVFAGDARALPPDPAARGLDVFLHVADSAVPGGRLEVVAKAYGFPTVTQAVPLANAEIEAGWDPESLDGAAPPPSVTVNTDAEGRARLSVEVPSGHELALSLLVAVRHGGHSRVRTATVQRGPSARIELHTADTTVVPTSTISAWVRAIGPSEEPLADAPVVVSLLEGGVARHSQTLRTDRGGMVMARVPIPRIDEPVWHWTLRAKLDGPPRDPRGWASTRAAEITLTPREENPGTPSLAVHWKEAASGARAGDRIPFEIRVRDATGQPIIDHPVRYWIGARGTNPPADDKEWEKLSTKATTDGAGEVRGTRDAPTLVSPKGTAIALVVKTVVEGHVLAQNALVEVGAARASAMVTPEAPAIVPGVSQRLLLTVLDGHGEGIASEFAVTADGLSTTVKTDARGEAELAWSPPISIGGNRNSGPCAGGVAAAITVRPLAAVEALRAQREPFALCLPVDRDADGLVRATPDVAKPGEKIHVVVERPSDAHKGRGSYSAILRSHDRDASVTGWLETKPDGSVAGDLEVPADAPFGKWDLSVTLPEAAREARVRGAEVLVVPTVLPQLTVKRVGGRATPGGAIEVEAQLTDGHGKGLPGSVSTVVSDAFGGGRADVSGLDTRSMLCASLRADDRCTAILERDPSTDAIRRALLGDARKLVKPMNDPGAHASTELEKAFGDVLRSLEGAVYEAAQSPQSLLDARRKENGRWVFNPELFTIVTASLNEPPVTPGGEHLTLSDLVAVDPQVTFDNVARRVTRLKLFRVLAAVRDYRKENALDPEEPVFKDPNALVRRLVQRQKLAPETLLDPWGGTLQFVKGAGAAPPFLGVLRGFELRAPGPDGIVGTTDDVKDPFERVVRSGSPYAKATREDAIVDAKWDMVVSEDTVRGWEQLFNEWTGTQMGDSFGAGGMGLSGVGEGGGGRGEGIGLDAIGTIGHGRGSGGIATGDAHWSHPVRTDAEGRVKLSIPLGSAETTWRVAFVGVADGHAPASAMLDIASDLPLSIRVDAGARWVEGDTVVAKAWVRNRTQHPLRATILTRAEGAIELDRAARTGAQQTVDVPAGSARAIDVRVKATRAGTATLVLDARAEGLPVDVLRHTWEVIPPGESRALTRTEWVDGTRDLRLELDHGYRVQGKPRLVLERGFDDAVADALNSLEPERQTSAHALLDAYETALLVQRWATTRDRDRHRALAAIADGIAQRALGRHVSYASLDGGDTSEPSRWALHARYVALSKPPRSEKDPKEGDARELCPPSWSKVQTTWGGGAFVDDDEVLEVEPPPSATVPPCWGAFVASATAALEVDGDAEHLARAILPLADRPHRAAVTAELVTRLRRIVKLTSDGDIDLLDIFPNDRARRALIYAALLRAQKLGTSNAPPEVLFAKIAVLRDADGGYGSSSATLAVVRALLASQLEGHGTTRVRVTAAGIDREVDVPESGSAIVMLPDGALEATVSTTGPGLVARLERPVLRLWSRPPPIAASPVSIEVVWPADARAGATSTLRVLLKHGRHDKTDVDARIPLPPGVVLGAPTKNASQLQGVLAIRMPVDGSAVLEVPLRFGLAGTTTAPEANARITRGTAGVAFAPARAVVVR